MDEISRTRPQGGDKKPDPLLRTTTEAGPAAATTDFELGPLPEVAGYRIIERLGEGGMGVVFKAVETALGRTVALKMIHGGRTASINDQQRFRTEARAVASITHPNVVRVFSSGDAGGQPYLAMEYLSAGSLDDRLKKQGRLNPRIAAVLVRKIALGLQAAHEMQIVHRDLKPGNILFDADDEPRVTDFGLAKREDNDMTASNAIMGTAAFMAPEQARGQSKFVGPAADLWALGVLFYECLTGTRPFQGETNLETLNRVIEQEPESMLVRVPGLSADLQAIVGKCLQKPIAARYASAADLAMDITRWLNGEPVRASLSDRWQIRFEATGIVMPVSGPARVLEGLREGEWDTSDEVMGPNDDDWKRIEDHPTFADAVGELAVIPPEPADETRLDMNPLIDVSLVLLIFFILTASAATLRRSIDIPAEPDDSPGKKSNMVKAEDLKAIAFNVTVWMEGDKPRIKLDETLVDPRDLENAMKKLVSETKKVKMILSVAGKVPWGTEALVHDAAKAAGVDEVFQKKFKEK